jgi:hypothetical protein
MAAVAATDGDPPIRVVVWDEQQPAQKQAYADFLGNEIASCLKKQRGLCKWFPEYLRNARYTGRPNAPAG